MLKDQLAVLHENLETSSSAEIKWAVELIVAVEGLTGAEVDTLLCAHALGPLWDGDVPSKVGRDALVELGFMAKVIVQGKEGYNACTYRGHQAVNLLAIPKNAAAISAIPPQAPASHVPEDRFISLTTKEQEA